MDVNEGSLQVIDIEVLKKFFLTFNVLVANSKKILYYSLQGGNPVRGLLNREEYNKKSLGAPQPCSFRDIT